MAATWQVGAGPEPALAGFLRGHLEGSWKRVKNAIRAGRVTVDGEVVTDPGLRLRVGAQVALHDGSPLPTARLDVRLVYVDSQLVVVEKPAGMLSVPFQGNERDTAMDRTRQQLLGKGGQHAGQLWVVQRIDRGTTGLLAFARTHAAMEALKAQFRRHSVERRYVLLAHGLVRSARFESRLVEDRGDGRRGSTKSPQGKLAVTHVECVETFGVASLCYARLETGRTHQIRIHLGEEGHPLLGDATYAKRFLRAGGTLLDAPRPMLHAATLGFRHPSEDRELAFESPLPADFEAMLAALRARSQTPLPAGGLRDGRP